MINTYIVTTVRVIGNDESNDNVGEFISFKKRKNQNNSQIKKKANNNITPIKFKLDRHWSFNFRTKILNQNNQTEIMLSSCVLCGFKQLLDYVSKNNNDELSELYCIGPEYWLNIGRLGKKSDLQVTITGNNLFNCKNDEKRNTINKTLARETGIVSKNNSLVQIGNSVEHITPKGNIQHVTNYVLNVEDCTFFTISSQIINDFDKLNNKKQNSKNKFQILLYGTLSECLSKLDNITHTYSTQKQSDAYIGGLCVISLNDVKNAINENYSWLI